MFRAILFDMGGTLDGDGIHWLDRFVALYRAAGVTLPREALQGAFDAAERRASVDADIASAPFRPMIEQHVRWQFESLALDDPALQRTIVDGFVAPVRQATAASARLLATLSSMGFSLGVLSNGCGNVDVLCDEFGFRPAVSVVIDSRRIGVAKPDPAIFRQAVQALEVAAGEVLMVGDSFDRDVRPAKALGMSTAWLAGEDAACPDPSLVDVRLSRLADLECAPAIVAAAGALRRGSPAAQLR